MASPITLRQFCASSWVHFFNLYSTMPVADSTYYLCFSISASSLTAHFFTLAPCGLWQTSNNTHHLPSDGWCTYCYCSNWYCYWGLKVQGSDEPLQCVYRKEIFERNLDFPRSIDAKRWLNFPSLCNPDFRIALFGASLCPNRPVPFNHVTWGQFMVQINWASTRL